jgi:D-alanyl-D-alanine carboxypeptidase/D-alanyl-D-alanine-endopeptidase (penicillin-binding protein 4)
MKFVKIILSCLLFCSWFANADNDAEIKKIINSYSFDQNNYSLIVKNLTQPEKLNFEHNSQSLFNSASLVKIITTFMAIEKLGPNFKWQSDFYHSGEIVDGILEGDLIFKGRGDASFSINDLEKMVVRLRQLGIYKINGDLVIDSTYFGSMPQEKNFDNDPLRAYNVLPDAVSIQANTINFKFDVIDNEIKIFKDPNLKVLEVVNQISLTQDKCRNWKSKITYDVSQEKNMQKIIFGGSISRNCESKEIDLYAIDDDIYFFENFKKLWLLSGGLFDGNLK